MTKLELQEYVLAMTDKMRATCAAKQTDYTGGSESPFANFVDSAAGAGITPVQGMLVRMGDKMARLKSFSQRGILEVKDESLEDTCMDLATYALLLAAFVKSEKVAPKSLDKLIAEGKARIEARYLTQGMTCVNPHDHRVALVTPNLPDPLSVADLPGFARSAFGQAAHDRENDAIAP